MGDVAGGWAVGWLESLTLCVSLELEAGHVHPGLWLM